jgi:aminopeptidase N
LAFLRPSGSIYAAILALTLFALVPATANAAKAKGKPRLNVAKLSKPPAQPVLVGEQIKLESEIRNRGRRAGRSSVKLIVPREKGASAGRKLASFPAKRFAPRSQRGFRFRFEVSQRLAPEGDALNARHDLAVCVRRHGEGSKFRCKTTKRPLTVGHAPLPPNFEPGEQSAGDPLFPQIGNTGYDVDSYDIALDYSPVDNLFRDGTKTTVNATATQNLGEFSLDFQRFDISRVTVDGERASFELVDAKPQLAGATQPVKLVVRPATGIPINTEFSVVVDYTGEPFEIIDPDGSSEGWVPACVGPPTPATCDGGVVVNEPIGAAGWFPNNNVPADKASYRTVIDTPGTHVGLGIGELVSDETLPSGRIRWVWTEEDATSTYLTTATVGRFDYQQGTFTETSTGRSLPTNTAIDSAITPIQRPTIDANLAEGEAQLNFLSDAFGPYPLDSAGAIVDLVPLLGYALEVQTKPVYAGGSVPISTQLHEYAHQWFGNSVSPATWLEIWFNEGWAVWSEWYWGFEENGGASPEDRFQDEYDNASANDWSTPPATLDGDPANLFANFPTYVRSTMTLEGYRQIVGDAVFFDFAAELQDRYGYGNVTTAQVIALAKELSGLGGAQLELLDDYFQQWLYGSVKPTILPASF